MPDTIDRTLRLPPDLDAALRAIARGAELPMQRVLIRALRDYVARHGTPTPPAAPAPERKPRPTPAAPAPVEEILR